MNKAVVARLASAALKADQSVERLRTAGSRFLGGLVSAILSDQELNALSVELYDQRAAVEAGSGHLWSWEVPWFERRLPAPPARLLVGAAGSGREVRFLASSGFTVDAFEPAERAAQRCSALVGNDGEVLVGDYEDLCSAVLDGRQTVLGGFATRQYDGVVLGWGSFSHLLDAADRLRLLRSAFALAAAGPVLASFAMRDGALQSPSTSRAWRYGTRVGGLFAPGSRCLEDCYFSPAFGFVRSISRTEIEESAATLGRSVVWEAPVGVYPHVTFVAPGSEIT